MNVLWKSHEKDMKEKHISTLTNVYISTLPEDSSSDVDFWLGLVGPWKRSVSRLSE